MHTSRLTIRATDQNSALGIFQGQPQEKNHKELMHKVWECSPMRVLTQAILDIIVHTDLDFDESNVKHVGVEFHMINKPHNIQNITCYIVSMPLCRIEIFSFVLHP